MKKLIVNLFTSLPPGPRLLVLTFGFAFPLALLGHYTNTADLYSWLGLSSSKVWAGQIWRVFSYGFLAASPIDWIISLFWLATLASILGRNWSAREFWTYCLLGIFAGALPIVFIKPAMNGVIAGSGAMIFALLVAWDWFYRNERLLLLGLGEISVRQAVILIAIIDSVVLFFCCGGWFVMLSMWCGGIAGWLYLVLRSKIFLGRTAQQIRSERVARLEL
jgi:membrane associated rhomboid family serine protease